MRAPPPRPAAPLRFDTPLSAAPGVGPVRARQLAEAGFETVGDLLLHLPARYEDRRRISTVAGATPGPTTFCGRLTGLAAVRTRRRGFSIVRGFVVDATGRLPVVWFNRPYLPKQVRDGEDYLLHGEVRLGEDRASAGGRLELMNPSCEPAAEALHGGRIVPVYPQAGGLGPALFRRLLSRLFAGRPALDISLDPLAGELAAGHGLPRLDAALLALHRPEDGCDVEALNRGTSPAHARLAYGELLELQLELAALRARQVGAPKRHAYRVDDQVRQVAREVLPFPLTAAQKRVLKEIVDDLRRPQPMLRLLQGDVGSGKTIVAALALVVALESNLQGALMAPTELLAEQHFRTLERWLGRRYRLALLTGSAARVGLAEAVARGEVQLVVGTQALIQHGLAFHRLGLAVVDEQHRFGVAQRGLLQAKGDRPDLLVMTATPIPRSLALTAYGDLDLSLLDELPPGRLPVATEVVPAAGRAAVYARLAEELAGGAQGYVVFPLIEESDAAGAASLASLGESVRGLLAGHACAVVHGALPAAERERVLAAFAAGEVRVLLATTVIEVGLDVSAATVMVIEGAERFGLAQLHQLRGRVGRGGRASRCVAVHGEASEEGRRRLEIFAATTDGFAIAEADLAIRGPGDLAGTRQTGFTPLRVADLIRDRGWLEKAREDARRLLPRLSEPGSTALRERLERRLARRARQELAGG